MQVALQGSSDIKLLYISPSVSVLCDGIITVELLIEATGNPVFKGQASYTEWKYLLNNVITLKKPGSCSDAM